jgi:hypothetical protein
MSKKSHNMTNAGYYRKNLFRGVKGVRPLSLRRLIALSIILRYAYTTEGELYQRVNKRERTDYIHFSDFIDGLKPRDFECLEDLCDDFRLSESDTIWLSSISQRTLQDYLNVLRHFADNCLTEVV